MARSHAVWVVIQGDSAEPVAAFTVRHELVTWLAQRGAARYNNVWIWRVVDGMRPWNAGERPRDVSAEFEL